MKNIISLALLLLVSTLSFGQQTQASNSWTAFSQSIDMSIDQDRKFILKGAVKVESKDAKAWAGLWARVDMKNDEKGFFDNMADRPINSSEWQEYKMEGTIDKDAEQIVVGGLMLLDGSFYFDNFTLQIEDEDGNMVDYPLDNASFEEAVSNETVDSWYEGVTGEERGSILEYTITSSEDTFSGKQSLLIVGSGTKPF